ncbi:MAG TPA: hypothetical protein VGY58_03405, partial [Gemmataceae bacterium]|nr:hypothetical protein [Gemmataceae bacterium]
MSILRRRFLFLAVLGLALAAPLRAADTASAPPTVVVRLRSLESLIANVKYLASLSAKPDDAKKLDPLIAMVNALQGIDSKRPIGFYGIADPGGNPQDSTGVALLPVTDEKSFLGALEKFNLKSAKDEDGIYTITAEKLPIPVFLRFANGYAYLSAQSNEPLQKDKLLPSSKVFSESYPELLSLTLRVDQIPDNVRQLIIVGVDARLANLDDEGPKGENKEQHEHRVRGAKEVAKHFVTFLNEGAEVSLRLDINRNAKQITVELSAAGKPGSSVAAHIKDLGKSQSLFAGLAGTDAALNAIVHADLPEPVRDLLGKVVHDAMQNLAKEKDATKRAHGEKILKALTPTVKSGELDAAVSLRGPGDNKLYTLVAG